MSSTFRSLRHRNARLFFAGLAVSNVGTWLQFTAMGLLVYRLTGRSTDLGITVALQFLPMLLFGAWAGAIADRVDKRVMAMITQAALAVQALTLGILDLAGLVTIPIVYGLSLALGFANAFDNPARRGFVTELVEPEEIGNAVSLNTAVMTGSRIFGPALAALLVGPLGTGWLFTLNGLSFTAILASLAMIDTSTRHPAPRSARGGTPVRDALRFVSGQPTMFAAFLAFIVVATFGFNYNVALPKLADERWGGDHWYGWLLTVVSVGSLTGSLLTARMSKVSMRWFAWSGVLLGVSGVLVAFSPNVVWAMAASIPLGIGGAGFVTGMNAITQQECPPEMRGRILALTAVAFLGSTPIGGPITGWVGDAVGPEWSLAYGAIISLAAVAVLGWWALSRGSPVRGVPDLRNLRRNVVAVGPSPHEHP
ncbi:MAG: MFS transporter [Ilumatobacter sp.]|nr:MAG: MFS transporter [Ilumatobacter sp.]